MPPSGKPKPGPTSSSRICEGAGNHGERDQNRGEVPVHIDLHLMKEEEAQEKMKQHARATDAVGQAHGITGELGAEEAITSLEHRIWKVRNEWRGSGAEAKKAAEAKAAEKKASRGTKTPTARRRLQKRKRPQS